MIFLDIEADNPDPRAEPDPVADSIVSIAVVGQGFSRERFVNPGFALTRSTIHGITDEQVVAEPKFSAIARGLLEVIEGQTICTYNGARYDVPLLWEEFERARIPWNIGRNRFIDLAILWRKMEPRSLADAVRRFAGREHQDAHTALADAEVLTEVLFGMRRAFGLADADDGKLTELTTPTMKIGGEDLPLVDLGGILARREDGEVVYTHKKNRGVVVSEDPGYGFWLLRQHFVNSETKHLLRTLLLPAIEEQEDQYLGESAYRGLSVERHGG